MILINTVDTKYFTLDGVQYARIYQPLAQGSQGIGIYSIYDTKQQIVNSTKFDEFSINGSTYATQEATIAAMLEVIWSGVSDYDVEVLENRVDNLEENQYSGVVVYSTFAELPVTGTLLVSYKVSNDPDTSKNGYYHWSGSVYVKDADLVIQEVNRTNTSDAVSGAGIEARFMEEINYPFTPNIASFDYIDDLRAFIIDMDLTGFPYSPSLYYSFAGINKNGASLSLTLYSSPNTGGGSWVSLGAFSASGAGYDSQSSEPLLLGHSNGSKILIIPKNWGDVGYIGSMGYNKAGIDPLVFTDPKNDVFRQEELKQMNIVEANNDGKILNGYVESVTYLHPNEPAEHEGEENFFTGDASDGKGYAQHYQFIEAGVVYKIGTAFLEGGKNFQGVIQVRKAQNYSSFDPASHELIKEYDFIPQQLEDDQILILDKSEVFQAGEVLIVYAIPEDGASYNVRMRCWRSPLQGEPNPNERIPFIWSGSGNNWVYSAVTVSYAYYQVPLRIYSNIVTEDQIQEIKQEIKQETESELRIEYFDPRIVLPSKLHAVVGKEFNLYYDSIALMPEVGLGEPQFIFDIQCNVGNQYRRGFRVTPDSGDIGSHSFTVYIYDNKENLIASKSTTLEVVAASVSTAGKQILCIGDSTTDDTSRVTKTLQENFAAIANTPVFLGTHGLAPYNHEARTGKTYSFYAQGGTVYKFTVLGALGFTRLVATYKETVTDSGCILVTETHLDGNGDGYVIAEIWTQPDSPIGGGWSGTLTNTDGDGANPLVVANTEVVANYSPFKNGEGVGALDISYYMTRFGQSGNIDIFDIDLGINDSRGVFKSESSRAQIITDAKSIIDAVLAAFPNCKIVVNIPKMCASTRSNNPTQHDTYRTNIQRLRELIIEEFDEFNYHANVYVTGLGHNIDRYYGYPMATQQVASRYAETQVFHTDDVHPRNEGYDQMADCKYAAILYVLAN